MNTTQMRNQVKQNIDKLSPEKLIVIAEFLRDLLNDENEDATEELLKIYPGHPGMYIIKYNIKII